jgi:GNAT superfamily N-acetyltransferase
MRLTAYFADFYQQYIWEMRRAELLKKTESGSLRIITAQDASGSPVAYCIASIGPDGAGEIDSMHVAGDFRGKGTGSRLVEAALEWFDRNNAGPVTVALAQGNEDAFPFYARFGLFPRKTVLQKKG